MSVFGWLLLHLLIGAAGTWLVRGYALRRALLDQPGERRSHAVATPRGGGAAIALALLLAVAWLTLLRPAQATILAGFGIGLALVALIGWRDDHRPLSPWLRLGVHVAAAALFAGAVWVGSGDPAASLVAFVAPLALTNVWNFMDGIDGLATTQALLVGAGLAWLAGSDWAWLALALIGAACGFLPWNFPRARVFLGDSGSGTLGYALGGLLAMAVLADAGRSLLALLPLSAFLLDAGLTLARRVSRGERWWTPHVTHAFQIRARRHGHVPVTMAYALWTALAIGLAFAVRDISFTSLIISLALWYAAGIVAWGGLRRIGASPVVENRE